MPGAMALQFDFSLSGGHAGNYLVQNVMQALVDKLVVKFSSTIL